MSSIARMNRSDSPFSFPAPYLLLLGTATAISRCDSDSTMVMNLLFSQQDAKWQTVGGLGLAVGLLEEMRRRPKFQRTGLPPRRLYIIC